MEKYYDGEATGFGKSSPSKSIEEEKACLNPLEDQRKQALEHYNELATRCSHWSGFVQRAIETYDPEILEREKEYREALEKIDAISFHKNEWKEMAEIGNIVKQLLKP